MSAGHGRFGSWPSTATWLEPDSNQTSTISVSLLNFVPPHLPHLAPAASASASGVYQASAPKRPKKLITLRLSAGSFSGLPQPSHRNTAMGTPQTRWREMHQSGRVAIMLEMRSSPHAGSHFTFLISSSVRLRSVPPSNGVSIEMNHCSVDRKITGLWQRQQCGYECSTLSACISTPRFFSNSTIGSFAAKTCLPSYSGKPLRMIPFSSTLPVRSSLYLTPVAKSSAPCDGAVWTTPVPVSIVTYSATTPRIARSRNGWAKFKYSSFFPGKWASLCVAARPALLLNSAASFSATMYTSPSDSDSSATYFSSGWKATAIDAGSVQGVVVQITVKTFFPFKTGSSFAGSSLS